MKDPLRCVCSDVTSLPPSQGNVVPNLNIQETCAHNVDIRQSLITWFCVKGLVSILVKSSHLEREKRNSSLIKLLVASAGMGMCSPFKKYNYAFYTKSDTMKKSTEWSKMMTFWGPLFPEENLVSCGASTGCNAIWNQHTFRRWGLKVVKFTFALY